MRTLILFVSLFLGYIAGLNAQVEYSLIDDYIASYQFDKALKYIDSQEETKELLKQKALCYKGLDNYSKAIEVLKSLAQVDKDDLKLKSEMALCYQALSNWSGSLTCYNELISLDSLNIYYKIKRAEMLFRLEDYKAALSDYKMLSDKYGLTNMIKRSAQCFENINLPDSAIVYYTEAIKADTTDVFSIASLININIKLKNFGSAIQLSDDFVEKDSTNKQINLLNGLSYYGADFYDEAVLRFERCYLNGDSSLVVNRSLGISYYSLGENEKAFPYLLKAYTQDTTNNRVLYCLGVVSNEMRNFNSSVIYFEKILEKTIPSDMILYLYYRGLAKGYEGLEEYKNAAINYKEATKYGQQNQNMYLYFTLGTIYDYELGEPSLALEYYVKYQNGLKNYLEKLKQKEDKEDAFEIKNVEASILSLNSHIGRLEKALAKNTMELK
ncbi:hypothetical protein G7050_14680 [Dysgonomonas sp. HDW5A]|uniref:tetratricopeptide repeat protein n=1 Tax=Dysgonomonas sp. HDW5A TaxID=2714926 RepID=UPI00140BF255|nr:hypothetical protein [Dysgonomonas sp. HDW5A]QIK61012.1 hypothetical protein G7050_14680 [Dysgonomonas sp. HDW5A]